GSTRLQPKQDMPFVVLWSDAAQGSYCRECELVAFLKPFLRQPRKDKRKPRSIPCLRVAGYFRVVDRLRDVFLCIRHPRFSTHFLYMNARHAPCFVEHLAGCLWE